GRGDQAPRPRRVRRVAHPRDAPRRKSEVCCIGEFRARRREPELHEMTEASRPPSPRPAERTSFLPFSRPTIGDAEIAEVIDCMRSGWITTGPRVERFTSDFAAYVGGRHASAVSSATAGLHLALLAHGIGAGDEVITSPMTFVATLNVIE